VNVETKKILKRQFLEKWKKGEKKKGDGKAARDAIFEK